MSTFWAIFWVIISVALGIFISAACSLVGEWVRKLARAEKEWEKGEAERKISGWLWAACTTVIVFMTILICQIGSITDKKFERVDDLENRFEIIEKQLNALPPTDTIYVIKYLPTA